MRIIIKLALSSLGTYRISARGTTLSHGGYKTPNPVFEIGSTNV